MKIAARPYVLSCGALGGRSPKTGNRVGVRHRWNGGAWGKGTCDFCGRTLSQVTVKPEPTPTLEKALKGN
jgi:hypothetical protein